MAVSKQNFLSSKRKEVRSTPSRLLLSIFSPPGVDLSFSVSACLTPPPRHIKQLLAPPFVSQPSDLLLQLRVIASGQTGGLGPLFSCLSIFFPTLSFPY